MSKKISLDEIVQMSKKTRDVNIKPIRVKSTPSSKKYDRIHLTQSKSKKLLSE
ncbi:MAG: hypothetical protein ACOWWH_07245 [Eubacteriaceae bacterium]